MNFWILLTFIPATAFSQKVLKYDSGAELEVNIIAYEQKLHQVDTCLFNMQPWICKIDGQEWYGGTMGLNLPEFQLGSVKLSYAGHSWNLDVSRMFNPGIDEIITKNHFRVTIKDSMSLVVHGWFSDGAGSYCAEWIITEASSVRTVLTNQQDKCFY